MFGLLIAFIASVEDFVTEMKPSASVTEDNAVSLKAYLAKSRHNLQTKQFHENPRVKNQEKPTL